EDIGAADEGLAPGAGEHDGAQVLAPGERFELADEGDHQMAVERVELCGVLDGHARNCAELALFHEDFDGGLVGHLLRFLAGTAGNPRRLTLRRAVTITPPCGRSAGWRIACNL